jgi:hypothetical protein
MTAQIYERLIYDGRQTSMACSPPLPEDHPRVEKLPAGESEPGDAGGIVFSTACWRGYVGTWEIKHGRFYLVALEGGYRLHGSEPLFADWFSGELLIPHGKMIRLVHMDFDTLFEREERIRIERGVVTGKEFVDNRGKDARAGQPDWDELPGYEI